MVCHFSRSVYKQRTFSIRCCCRMAGRLVLTTSSAKALSRKSVVNVAEDAKSFGPSVALPAPPKLLASSATVLVPSFYVAEVAKTFGDSRSLLNGYNERTTRERLQKTIAFCVRPQFTKRELHRHYFNAAKPSQNKR